jgi:BirA family biotin operon repressor/biotin-[acetyl-CoA-carboxylase] ligase
MDEARRTQDGGPRSIFVADEQTAGRGRHGRSWLADAGTALQVSIVFEDGQASPWRYTTLIALALAEAIELAVPGVRPSIKWPNDLMLDGRKVAGILAESSFNGERLRVIVGVGVNVTAAPPEVPTATCLGPVDRGALLHAFIGRLDAWLARPIDAARAAWQARLWGRGQRVRLVELGMDQMVVVLGVEPDGALRVRLGDGSERVSFTGELLA